MDLTQKDYNHIMQAVDAANCFGQSQRQKSLFEFLLTRACNAEASPINAYIIAFDVFGLDSSFDNSKNSLVRVEMHKLRKNLKALNRTDSNYIVSLPLKTYDLTIQRRVRFKPKGVLFITLAGLILTPIALLFLQNFRTPSKSTQTILEHDSYKPLIYIEILNDSHFITSQIATTAQQKWGEIIHNNYAEVSNNSNSFDYKLSVSSTLDVNEVCQLKVEVSTKFGKVIDTRSGQCLIHPPVLGYSLQRPGFWENSGKFVNYYMTDTNIDPTRRELFSCNMKASWLLQSINSSRTSVAETLSCLEKAKRSNTPNKSEFYSTTSALYLAHLRGELDLNITDQNALKMARENRETSDEYYISSTKDMYFKIMFSWHEVPVNHEAIKSTLLEAEETEFESEIILYLSAITYAFYLADWDKSLEILENENFYNKNTTTARPYVLLAKSIHDGDNLEAEEHYNYLPTSTGSTHSLFSIWTGCHSKDNERVQLGIQNLKRVRKSYGKDYLEILKRKQFAPKLEQSLMTVQQIPFCSPYMKELGFQ